MTDALIIVRAFSNLLLLELGEEVLGESLVKRGWLFGFDRARVRLGQCVFGGGEAKFITLSTAFAEQGWTADVEDAVRHEIAHALDYELNGESCHDEVWRELAVRCGAKPIGSRRGPRPKDDASPYVGRCPACGHEEPFYRPAQRPHRCPMCKTYGLRFRERRTGAPVLPTYLTTCPGCGREETHLCHPGLTKACGSCCRQYANGVYDRRFVLSVRRTTAEDHARMRQEREQG